MHLVEEHSVVDPTYIEDFLLTYRTFLSSPMEIGKKLLEWFNDPSLRDKVSQNKRMKSLISEMIIIKYSTVNILTIYRYFSSPTVNVLRIQLLPFVKFTIDPCKFEFY